MTRRARLLPWLPVPLALAAVAWLLLSGGSPDEEEAPAAAERAGAPPDAAGPRTAPADLSGTGPEEPPPRRAPKAPHPRDLPRGTVLARAVGPDEKPFLPAEARIFLDPVGRAFPSTPVGVPDPETGVWRFEKVLAGRVRVRVHGDFVVEAASEVVVEGGGTAEVTVHADRGGSVAYRAVLYSGEPPPKVTLTLLDVDRKPVRAWWQVRSATEMTTPRQEAQVTQGPEGVVYGLLPGRYRLRSRTPEDDVEEVEVTVVAGEQASVELRHRS